MYGKEFFGLFMEMGTGKTKLCVDEFVSLFLKGEIDGVIITAPKSFYLNWLKEIPKHMPKDVPYRLLFWDADLPPRKRERLWGMLIPEPNKLDILLINVEAFANNRGFWFGQEFAKMHYPYFIVDESTCIKNANAERSKAVRKVAEYCNYKRILTGTPLTQGPLDLFGQFEFLKPGMLGFTSYTSFKAYHADVRVITYGTRRFEKIDGFKNVRELQDKIKPYVYRVLKADCLDLPEKIFKRIEVPWTPEQTRIYTEMKDEYMVQFSREHVVSTTSALSALTKLHQINCGHVTLNPKTPGGKGEVVRIKNNRIKIMLELVELIPGKIIIWAKFKEDIKMIIQALIEAYGDGCAVDYYGDTITSQRIKNLEAFDNDPNCRFFVSNETGSKSLTLVQAAYAIYYSYDHKLETWLQSQDRNHRIGQDKNVTYFTMVTPKSVDETILKNLFRKRDMSAEFLDWKQVIDDQEEPEKGTTSPFLDW